MDKISKERRSQNMRRIKATNTSVELRLRRALWAHGIRGYRVHSRNLAGKPDIAFTRWKTAVFIDGCFWHACPRCFVAPSSNTEYWRPKIARNVERDREVDAKLAAEGWQVVRLWEHDVREDLEDAINSVTHALDRVRYRCL